MLAAVVEVGTMQVIATVLALVAGAFALLVVGARLFARRAPVAAAFSERVADHRNLITFALAAAATAGSLYFSEIAHYVPCRLCWFQRICMYPITGVALVALVRRDPGGRWYAALLAVVGAPISAYHYLIEWKPDLDTGACELFGPACTDIWFRTWGFATLAFMALCGFAAILATNLAPRYVAPSNIITETP